MCSVGIALGQSSVKKKYLRRFCPVPVGSWHSLELLAEHRLTAITPLRPQPILSRSTQRLCLLTAKTIFCSAWAKSSGLHTRNVFPFSAPTV